MLAMVADKAYESVEDCCGKLIQTREVVRPDKDIAERYEKQYQKYREIYPTVKQLYKTLRK